MDDGTAALIAALVLGVVLAGAGWLITSLARRGAAGTLRRNQIAGIRTSMTLASDEAWQAAHLAGEADTVRAGVGGIVGGALCASTSVLALAGLPSDTVFALSSGFCFVTTLWLVVWTAKGALAGHKAAAQIPRGGRSR